MVVQVTLAACLCCGRVFVNICSTKVGAECLSCAYEAGDHYRYTVAGAAGMERIVIIYPFIGGLEYRYLVCLLLLIRDLRLRATLSAVASNIINHSILSTLLKFGLVMKEVMVEKTRLWIYYSLSCREIFRPPL